MASLFPNRPLGLTNSITSRIEMEIASLYAVGRTQMLKDSRTPRRRFSGLHLPRTRLLVAVRDSVDLVQRDAQPGVADAVLEQRLMRQWCAAGDDDAIESVLFHALGNQRDRVLRTGIQFVFGVDDVRQCTCIFSHGRYVEKTADV